jgi:hypothetical protein
MAFSLKKWITGQMESARLNDYNDNMTAIEGAIDTLQTNASLLPILATITGSILEHATSLGAGLYVISTGANTTDLPDSSFKFMPAIICKQSQTNGVILAFSYAQPSKFAINIRTSSGWGGWKVFS